MSGSYDVPTQGNTARPLTVAGLACGRYYTDQAVVAGPGTWLGVLSVWAKRESCRRLLWRLVSAQGAGWLSGQAAIQHPDGVQVSTERRPLRLPSPLDAGGTRPLGSEASERRTEHPSSLSAALTCVI